MADYNEPSATSEIKDTAKGAANTAKKAYELMSGESVERQIVNVIQRQLARQAATNAALTGTTTAAGSAVGSTAGTSAAAGTASGATAGATAATAGGTAAGTAGGTAAAGATAGSAGGPIGALVGLIAGVVIGAVKNIVQTDTKDNVGAAVAWVSASLIAFLLPVIFIVIFIFAVYYYIYPDTMLSKGLPGMIAMHHETEFQMDEVLGTAISNQSDEYQKGDYELDDYDYELPLKHGIALFIYGPPDAEGIDDDEYYNYIKGDPTVEIPEGIDITDWDLGDLSNEELVQSLMSQGGFSSDRAAAMTAAYQALNAAFPGQNQLIIGIMANIAHEGSIGMAEKTYKTLNTYDQFVAYQLKYGTESNHALGMCQWDSHRRYDLLEEYKTAALKAGGSLTPAQMAQVECNFMIKELKGKESSAVVKINATTTAQEAAFAVATYYERCAVRYREERKATGDKIAQILQSQQVRKFEDS